LAAPATAVAITPDQGPDARLAVSSVRLAAGQRVSANAVGSSSAPSPLAKLTFSFGDGTAAVTAPAAAPRATHVYRQAGRFHLTVTATDAVGTSSRRLGTGQTLLFNGTANASADQTVVVFPTLTRLGARRAAPGQRVTVLGTGFATRRGATTVRFGTERASSVTCRSHTRCVVVVPRLPRGARTVNVGVTVGGESSSTVTLGRFTFLVVKRTVAKPRPRA